MRKKQKNLPCYGAVWRKPPDVTFCTLGHLRQGFFILKNKMIIKKDGRYYIALHEATTLEDISDYQTSLVNIISCATQSGLFDGSQNAIYSVCGLLQEIMLTSRQMSSIELKRINKLFDVEIVP